MNVPGGTGVPASSFPQGWKGAKPGTLGSSL